MEKIFERYKTKVEWEAHNELILASTLSTQGYSKFLITGGNDDTIAIWDLAGFLKQDSSSLRPSNGTIHLLRETTAG